MPVEVAVQQSVTLFLPARPLSKTLARHDMLGAGGKLVVDPMARSKTMFLDHAPLLVTPVTAIVDGEELSCLIDSSMVPAIA